MQAVDLLASLCAGVEVRFNPATLTPHGRRLLAALGVTVVEDGRAPSHCCFRPSGRRGERRAAGLHVWDPAR